jgi:hypothetical protein
VQDEDLEAEDSDEDAGAAVAPTKPPAVGSKRARPAAATTPSVAEPQLPGPVTAKRASSARGGKAAGRAAAAAAAPVDDSDSDESDVGIARLKGAERRAAAAAERSAAEAFGVDVVAPECALASSYFQTGCCCSMLSRRLP